jgi:hypothetical protein
MRVRWSLLVVVVLVVVALAGPGCVGGGSAGTGHAADAAVTGHRTVLRPHGTEVVVIEALTVGDAARATLTVGTSVVAAERRVGSRYFARVRGAEAVLGFDRWISFDLADPAEAAAARRLGPGLLQLVEAGSFDGYDVVRRTVREPPPIEPPRPGAHVPVGEVPEAVGAGA